MDAGKPCLLDMGLWQLLFWRGPEGGNKGAASFVHRNRVQGDVDMRSDLGVVEAEKRQCDVAAERREPDTGGNAVRSTVSNTPTHLIRGQGSIVFWPRPCCRYRSPSGRPSLRPSRPYGPLGSTRKWFHRASIVASKPLRVGGSLDPRRVDQPRERAGGIGAAGKSENIDFVAALVICRHRLIGLLDNFPQTDTDRSA